MAFIGESALAVAASTMLAISLAWLRRNSVHSGLSSALDVAVAIFVLTPLLTKFGILALGSWSLYALPIHVCDVAGMLLVVGLIVRTSKIGTPAILTSLLYSSIALCQPDLGHGSSVMERMVFWSRHISLVVGSVYLVAGLRVSLSWSGFRIWILIISFYVAVIFVVNHRFGTNFAYLGPSVSAPEIVLALGPWPYRVWLMVGIPMALGAVLTGVFAHVQRRDPVRGTDHY